MKKWFVHISSYLFDRSASIRLNLSWKYPEKSIRFDCHPAISQSATFAGWTRKKIIGYL